VTLPEGRAPLRILYHHRIAASDGMRVHVDAVVGQLRARGCEVRVVGPGDGEDGPAAGEASRLERLADGLRRRLPRAAYELLELAYNVPAYLRLAAAARDFRPDVVYERNNLFLLAGLMLRARRGIPLLLEINAPLAAERKGLGQLQLEGLGRRCEGALWRGADAALPVTEVLARAVRRTRGRQGVHVIPNGADPSARPSASDVAAARRALNLDAGDLVLGFAGFVRAWHGVGWALEALPHLPAHVRLVIIGDGPALPELAARAQELGVADRVRLPGRAPHAAVAAYMACFDVALQTAATAYASPLKLFEYMALGLAIVAPDQPNIREVLHDSDNALLFAPGAEAGFRAALQRLCRDGDLRRTLGYRAALTITERPFTWAHNAERIEVLARALVSDARRPAPGAAYAANPA
jgi:glycosyltransferase involved in cell wall biosynthesis